MSVIQQHIHAHIVCDLDDRLLRACRRPVGAGGLLDLPCHQFNLHVLIYIFLISPCLVTHNILVFACLPVWMCCVSAACPPCMMFIVRGVLLDRLRGLLAAKERLVHALQHELTTPIHGMMGECGLRLGGTRQQSAHLLIVSCTPRNSQQLRPHASHDSKPQHCKSNMCTICTICLLSIISRLRHTYAILPAYPPPPPHPAALVQELLHNKTQSASSRTRMLLMIRSSAACLLNTISTALNSSSSSSSTQDGLPGQVSNGTGHDSPSGRRMHKVGVEKVIQVAMSQHN